MNLFINFDKTAKPDTAAQLSNQFFEHVVGSTVRYQNQAITDVGIHWLVSAADALSVKEKIERIVGDGATVTVQNENGITVAPA